MAKFKFKYVHYDDELQIWTCTPKKGDCYPYTTASENCGSTAFSLTGKLAVIDSELNVTEYLPETPISRQNYSPDEEYMITARETSEYHCISAGRDANRLDCTIHKLNKGDTMTLHQDEYLYVPRGVTNADDVVDKCLSDRININNINAAVYTCPEGDKVVTAGADNTFVVQIRCITV